MTAPGFPLERVSLEVEGLPVPHKSCSLTASAEDAVRNASFTFALPPLEKISSFAIRPDMKAIVKVSGELWLTGLIGDVSVQHLDGDGEIGVDVYSKVLDTVEASVDHPTGYIESADALKVAKEFESTGIKWRSNATLQVERSLDINPGESNFATVEQALRSRGKLIYDDENGDMNIADKPEGRHSGGIELGKNIKGARGNLTSRGRFNPVKVRGQSSIGHGPGALRVEAEVADETLGRRRPKIILIEGDVTDEKAKQRAEYEVRRANGNSKTVSVDVPGWRDGAGKLWTRNWLVGFVNPLLFLAQDMIIKSVTFNQDGESASGTFATLELADPQALGGQAGKSSSDAVWKTNVAKAKVVAL